MGNIFGKRKTPSKITEQDRAILQLKQQRDNLHKYQKRIEVQLVKDKEMAKKLLSQNKKEKAKLLLRKKKFQETILVKTDGQLENIERMVHDLEFAQIEVQVVKGLKVGNEALNKIHQILSIADVEKIMEETEAAVSYQREIDDILAGGLSDQDEMNVELEYDQMMMDYLKDMPTPSSDELLNDNLESASIENTLPSAHILKDKSPPKRIAIEAS